jgi:CAP-Gly domain-containing linker protein 1
MLITILVKGLMLITSGKPHIFGIPTPGKSSGIPPPGRLHLLSNVANGVNGGGSSHPDSDVDFLLHTLANAIKVNDPAQHHSICSNNAPPTPFPSQSVAFMPTSGPRFVTSRPQSATSSTSTANSTTSKNPQTHAKPPAARPASHQSDVFRSISQNDWPFEVRDNVRIKCLGFEGVLHYLGGIDEKVGTWAGVELSRGFAGKGKDNGSVNVGFNWCLNYLHAIHCKPNS